jgi:hypothetical protein
MLYEMVTGHPPFVGSDPTAIISQHINIPPVAPSWQTEHCPPALEQLILQMLEKDPGKRPASAIEVLAALDHVDPAQKSASHSDSNVLESLARGVFVGREKELERLRKAFDNAFAGHGSVVMLVGEPGIGKTRTTEELDTYARMRGAQAHWGRAHESSGAPPYWPLIQVVQSWAASNDIAALGADLPPGAAAELSRIFPWLRDQPNVGEPAAILEPEVAQFRLFAAYASLLKAMARRTPLVVVLDDLHWSDKPTLLLLQHVARELGGQRVLVVGTFRDTDLSRTHPLSEALATLNREPGFLRVPLRGLNRDEVETYIRSSANVRPAARLIDRIFEETEGNPFFLSEVVNLMTQEGTLTKESVSDIAVPDGVKEALGRRLDRISEETNELLQVAAIVGREFTYDTLTLLGDKDEDALLKQVEEAVAARVIEEMGQAGRYRFTHALMQETLLGELSTTRRVRLHGQVGEALEKRWGARADEFASRLAQHFMEAAILSERYQAKALHYAELAAAEAARKAAWTEAEGWYERCLSLVSEAGDRLDADEAGLLLRHGSAARYAGDVRNGWRSLLRSLDLFRARKDANGAGRAALVATTIYAQPARHIAILDFALGTEGERDPAIEAALLAHRASRLGFPAGDADADRAEALCRLTAAPEASGLVKFARAEAALLNSEPEEGLRLLKAAVDELLEHGLQATACQPSFAYVNTLMHIGSLDDSRAAALRYEKLAREIGDTVHTGNARFAIACLAFLRGDFAAAQANIEQVSDTNTMVPLLTVSVAEARGEIAGIEKLVVPIETVPNVDALLLQSSVARAEAFFLAGDHEAAKVALARMEELVARISQTGPRTDGLAAAGALIALGSDDAIRARYESYKASPWMRGSWTGSVDRVRGQLALRLGLVDEAAEWFGLGLEWCERERCPVEAGRCLQGLAEVAERRGDHPAAMALLDRAGALFSQHGAKLYLDQVLAKKEILKA